MLKFQVTANKSPRSQGLPSGKSREKTVCLSCVKEGYHVLDRGFLQAVEPGEHGGREGRLREGGLGP